MKKILLVLGSAFIGYLVGVGAQIGAQSHIGGDSQWSLEQFLVTRKNATVENSITAVNGNWRISDEGVLYVKQIVLEPATLDDLLPVDGALIFLDNPVQIGMGYGGSWKFCQAIPEENWGDSTITTDGDIALYCSGRKWLARTADLGIQ